MGRTARWFDAMFEDTDTGERFFVELDMNDFDGDEVLFVDAAENIASDYYDGNFEYITIVDKDTADELGYDTL